MNRNSRGRGTVSPNAEDTVGLGFLLGDIEMEVEVEKHGLAHRREVHPEGLDQGGSQGAAQHVLVDALDGHEREPVKDKTQLLIGQRAGGDGGGLGGGLARGGRGGRGAGLP